MHRAFEEERGEPKPKHHKKTSGPVPDILSSMFFSVLRNKKKKENMSYCSFAPTYSKQ